MVFSSITFLYYFLPAFLLVYFLVPAKVRNITLLVASLLFYGWGEPRYVLLMCITIFAGYIGGIVIDRYRQCIWGKIAFISTLFVCIGVLFFFKYADFFIESFSRVTGIPVKALGIALPIGISFYTFQLISYVIDVYRQSVSVQKNIVKLFTYVAMFPQLIAGPIVRYKDIETELSCRSISVKRVRDGISRFIVGLGKKVIIANELYALITIIRESGEKSILFMWTYAVATGLYVYYDFSGYSDMAIGLGRIMGFTFPENFNYPFISGSITEFWRRWHMTLGGWFRDYVYIPMGGSRVGMVRLIVNIIVVWLLTGLWHGAAWNFVLWGMFFAILLIIEKLWLLKPLERTRIVKHIYVLFAMLISFVLFNGNSVKEAFSYIGDMFGGSLPISNAYTLYYLKSFGILILAAIIGSTPLVKKLYLKLRGKLPDNVSGLVESLGLLIIMMLATACLVDGSFNPFMYFRF